MAQTIKSLKQQMTNVKVNGFAVKDYKKGDYGYNLVYGLLDDKIEVAFKIPYQNENADVAKEISEILEQNIGFVRFINAKLIPKDCALVKFIDGEYLNSFQMGIAVDGRNIEFSVFWVYWQKNHPSYKPPIRYSLKQVIKNIKKSVANYIANFKALLDSTEFHYENHSVVSGLNNTNKTSLNLKINGSAFGINDSFIVEDFENANIKKILKRQLKIFKDRSEGKITETKDNVLIDLRNYPELVAALAKEERLTRSFYKNETPQKKSARDEFCKTTLIPLAKKIFGEVDAKFIDWRIGEELDWNELFPENFFEDCDYNDIRLLTLILDRGSTGKYIWKNKVITASGQALEDERKELLQLGKDVNHNLRNTYMIIRDDDLILDKDNNIVYNQKQGRTEQSKKLTVKYITDNVKRLTHNISIFKSNEDKYKANAMIAIYYSFLGETEKAKEYKKLVDEIKLNNVQLDEKIEVLLKGIK